jgi:hypothetical protein
MSLNYESIYRVGTKFDFFRIFFCIFGALTIKIASFSI